MALEISVISREIIKPSSPTPHHLRHHALSIIDQYVNGMKACCILFYASPESTICFEPASILKSSLSKTLTDFYPLAGRISDNESIECNDEGVHFLQTRVIGRKLDQIISGALGEELAQLVPKGDGFDGPGPKVLLSIQLNQFDCGGMALCVCIGHKAIDGGTLSLFLQNWAACARGDHGKILRPNYGASLIFPGKEGVKTIEFPIGKPSQKIVTRRFVFCASNIAALKAKCATGRNVKNPTTVEVVTAVIWRSAMNAMRMTMAVKKPKSQANIAVNLRGRLIPPLSNQYVGNVLFVARPISGIEDADLGCLAEKIHATIAVVNSDFYRKPPESNTEFQKAVEDFEIYVFTSWRGFRFYETDFGWGEPTWMSSAELPSNCVILMDSKDGVGLEAWVSLDEREMAKFVADPYITAFTCKGANHGSCNISSRY